MLVRGPLSCPVTRKPVRGFRRTGTCNMTSANSQPVWRVEDEPLLRGRGRFIDDAPRPNQAYGHFVRSPHAHGRIRSIDIEAARAAEGVLAVLTAADMAAAGAAGPITRHFPMTGRDGKALIKPVRPALAGERVMHVGQPVALVVATSAALAQDAAERVVIDYDELDVIRLPRATRRITASTDAKWSRP